MTNDMVSPEDLEYLPGAPFTDAEVDAAVATLRLAAGWHIAPTRTETISLDVTECDRWLRLPTRRLVSVNQISDADTSAVIDPARYRVSRNLCQVKQTGAWPSGYERVDIDITHGYDETPPALLAVIGEAATIARRDQSVSQLTMGPFSQSFGMSGSGTPIGAMSVLAEYSVFKWGFA